MSDPRAQRDIARRLEQTEVGERAFTNYGAAFPTSPSAGRTFFRTDLGWWVYYDGTRWLTVHEDTAVYAPWGMLLGTGTNASLVIATIPLPTDYAAYFTRVSLKCYSTVAGTGLVNYHRIWIDVDGGGFPNQYGVNLNTIAAGTWTDYSGNINAPVSGMYSQVQIQKVGTPTGTVYVLASVRYRLVIP